MRQTNVSICGYEMNSMELLDRALIAIQNTEDSFIDINNRIISNVNQRKDRLNNLNTRIHNISQKVLALYNNNQPMRVESPANFPTISTHKANNMHPHQSIFYDRKNIFEEETKNSIQRQNEEQGLPQLYSMQFKQKIFNNRLSNHPENLGALVTGITKDINDLSQVLLNVEKYGQTIHQLKKEAKKEMEQIQIEQDLKKVNQDRKKESSFDNEGVLGKMPENIESIAELMLWDSDVNVY